MPPKPDYDKAHTAIENIIKKVNYGNVITTGGISYTQCTKDTKKLEIPILHNFVREMLIVLIKILFDNSMTIYVMFVRLNMCFLGSRFKKNNEKLIIQPITTTSTKKKH